MKMKEFLSADMQEKQTKKCQFCAEEINIEAIKCKHCYSDLNKIIPRRKEYIPTKEDADTKEIPSFYNRDRKNSDGKKAQSDAINIFKIFIYMFIAFIAIVFWYIAIPALFIWLIWKKTKLTEKNKLIISITILLFFIILKISSDYNHRAPVITITEPENNISVQSDSITIKGLVDPENSQLHIEGNQVSLKNGNFKYEVRLTEESNAISLVADSSGKKIENLLTVNRILSDDERAIVNLENIKNNDVVNSSQFEIEGKTQLKDVIVKINDQDVDIIDNQFFYTVDLNEGANNIDIVATNMKSSIVRKETIIIIREITEEEKQASIKEEENKRIELENKDFKNQLQSEIDSIEVFDGSIYKENIELEIALFSAYANIINKAETSNEQEINKLGNILKEKVRQKQIKEFPLMRKSYGEKFNATMWEHNVDVRVFGTSNNTIELTGALFANNKNVKDTQMAIQEMLKLVRFDRVNYKWYKYDDEYTYFSLKSYKDDEIIEIK